MMRARICPALLCGALLAAASAVSVPAPAAAERHVAIVVDTSGSMDGNDPKLYTRQFSQILADLLDEGDRLTVIRMAGSERFCSGAANRSLALRLDPADREGFKQRLYAWVAHNTETNFVSAIRTALDVLPRDPEIPRLLLVIADSGGLGGCEGRLTDELKALRRSGAMIAAINLGSTAGAFDSNPAFTFTTPALDSQQLIEAVARVYQQFLGAKRVQTGQVRGPIRVEIAPHVSRAFLVVAADGPVDRVVESSGNPGARSIDANYRGGGETVGGDGVRRGYRIVRLERPRPGRWSFEVPGLRATGGFMLVQDFRIGVRLLSPTVVDGAPSLLRAELYDEETGAAIRDTAGLTGLDLEAEVDGKKVRLHDDGTSGDETAGDGIFSAQVELSGPGKKNLDVHIESDVLDRDRTLEVEVVEGGWELTVTSPPSGHAGAEVELSVVATPLGQVAGLEAPRQIEVEAGGETVVLSPESAGGPERRYSGSFVPPEPGSLSLTYRPVGGARAEAVSAPLEILAGGWELVVTSPPSARAGEAVELSVVATPLGGATTLPPPERIEVATGSGAVELLPQGPEARGEGGGEGRRYAGSWTPPVPGSYHLDYLPIGSQAPAVGAPLEVRGVLRFGELPAHQLGPVTGGSEVFGELDLSSAEVRGSHELALTTDFPGARTVLEIDTGAGWQPLGREAVILSFAEGGPRRFPLRLRVGSCPPALSREESFHIEIRAAGEATPLAAVPLGAEVLPDPWLHCWWPALAALAGALLVGVLIHGWWSPSRFGPKVGVVLSPEEDLDEGFFHPVRATRGTGSGFYRDATAYICPDFRLSGKARGAIARLRAHGASVRIRPEGGGRIFRLTADGEWEALPAEESGVHFGCPYRNDLGSIFFAVRKA